VIEQGIETLILEECRVDDVGLWEVVSIVRSKLGPDNSMKQTLRILRKLLDQGSIVAGFPTPDGRAFQSWDLGPEETISRIEFEWRRLGRTPTLGEIAWFTAAEGA
jgi:hypothetical protein